ncbi:MAG: BolA/IbaG family iron-sulfur metabolism protein [Candidatus Margulisiibacteriota bacterium]
MNLVNEIEKIIISHIPDAWIIVNNINNDGEHFEAVVISKSFNELSLLKQHKAVMKPLQEAFNEKVHALGLKTFSKENWLKNKSNYPMIESLIKEKYKQ